MRKIFIIVLQFIIAILAILLFVIFKNDIPQSLYEVLFSIVLFVLIVLSITATMQNNRNYQEKLRVLEAKLGSWNETAIKIPRISEYIANEMPTGILIYNENLEASWVNEKVQDAFKNVQILNAQLSTFNHDLATLALLDDTTEELSQTTLIEINEKFYDVVHNPKLRVFFFYDVTKREELQTKYNNRIAAIGLISFDNFNDAMINYDLSEQTTIKASFLTEIASWVTKHNGYMRTYANDLIYIVTTKEELEKMKISKFEILERIKTISKESKAKVTLSIGFASWDETYELNGGYAQSALELAERRGGDQAVVNIQNMPLAFYGARSVSSTKNSRVEVRIKAQLLNESIVAAKDIYIMSHKHADADAVGSMLCLYYFAKSCGKNAKLVIQEDLLDDVSNNAMQIIFEEDEQIKKAVISQTQLLEDISAESLLIITDTQWADLLMVPQVLLQMSKDNLVIIDHHRSTTDSLKAKYVYIEPAASSSVELCIELLQFVEESEININAASLMFLGIKLDTIDFTTRIGTRTFEVLAHLKGYGADPLQVKMWSRNNLSRIKKINNAVSEARIYMKRFAIIVKDEIVSDRVLLAQISDKSLEIDGVDASFTIAKLDEATVGISARSYNNINVQVLMENFNGGGHMQSAAAQVTSTNVFAVLKELKNYINLEYDEGEKMKIILLEDVNNKGKKDQVIDVATGYANHLITTKKAVVCNEENLAKLEADIAAAKQVEEENINLMKILKNQIDGKIIEIPITVGNDGRLFGTITTKNIVEEFEKNYGIKLDRKKVEISGEINSLGIYTVNVTLHKIVKASFEVKVIKKN